MNAFTLSAFSDEYADGLREQCEALRKLGICCTEIRFVDGKNVSLLTEREAFAVKGILDSFGISVSSVGSPLGKTFPRDADGSTIGRVFATAKIFGAAYVRVFSFYRPEGVTDEHFCDDVYEGMEKIVSAGEKYGILPCHENEANIYGESPTRCRELMERFGAKLGCVFDMGNFVLDGYDAWAAYLTLRDHITYFHIKDALAAGAVVPPGAGEARIADILNDFSAHCFLTLEPHLETFSGLNAIAGKSFVNPYRYQSREEAFEDALRRLRKML